MALMDKIATLDAKIKEMKTSVGLEENVPLDELVAKVASSGGGDIEEYFNTEITQDVGSSGETAFLTQLVKKLPNINVSSSVTSMSNAFLGFGGDSIPEINGTENVTNLYQMFKNCKKITTVPLFDTSNVTNMSNLFYGCDNLTTVPLFNTSNVTNMSNLLYNCNKLTEVPHFDTSKVTNMNDMVSNCKKITTVPHFDTSNVQNMNGMFSNCLELITIPQLDTSNVTSIQNMFAMSGNSKISSIPKLNGSKVTNLQTFIQLYNGTNVLTEFGGLENIGQAYAVKQSSNYSYFRFSLTSTTKLTHESLMNVINNLYDLNLTYDVANGGTLYTQQLQLGGTNLAKLTAEEIAIATNKG